MKTKNLFRVLPAVAAMLLLAACSSDEQSTAPIAEPEAPASEGTVIHYSATVSDGTSTRATLNSSKQYEFQTGDKLKITTADGKLTGDLTLTSGDGTANATFEGDLTYTGSGTPANGLVLQAVLVSTSNAMTTLTYASATYPTTAIASTLAEAVQKYSYFKATSTYSAKTFSLSQQTSFLNFTVTLTDGTTTGTDLGITITNGGATVRTGSVTTVTDGGVKAKFVAAMPSGTTMSNASVQLGSKAAIPFGGSTALAANKIYNIKKTIYPVPTTFTYTGDRQTYSVPASGWYTIQAYGAEGGKSFKNRSTSDDMNDGGKGGYSAITYNLTKGQTLYIYCGGMGGNGSRNAGGIGGWNGGGAGGNGCDASTTGGGGGGGATHVATSSIGEITGSNNLFNHTANLILVAGGGGGGAYNSCVAGVGGNLFNYGTRSDGGIFDKYADGSQTKHDGSQGAVGKTGNDADHKRGGSGGQGGGFRAITDLPGQDMTYAGFGGSSWGDTTNGTGYNSVSGGATEGDNGKVIISWVNSPLQGLNDYNQENKDW